MKAFKIISIVLILVIILYFIYKYLFKKDTTVKEVAAPALTESQLQTLLASVHPDIQNVAGDLTTLNR